MTDQKFTILTEAEINALVKRWYRSVLGSEEDIRGAIIDLDRAPLNAIELQDTVFKIRREQMVKIAEESRDYY